MLTRFVMLTHVSIFNDSKTPKQVRGDNAYQVRHADGLSASNVSLRDRSGKSGTLNPQIPRSTLRVFARNGSIVQDAETSLRRAGKSQRDHFVIRGDDAYKFVMLTHVSIYLSIKSLSSGF